MMNERLLEWYGAHGRSHLPWRNTRDPYCILVSEFMLQQTQVDRVLPKYEAFIARFPTLQSLAAASIAEVLRLWKGLGYNSRAVRLRRLACEVQERFGGVIPADRHSLATLPGVGPYTVDALGAFAFGEDTAANDTNVRRVVHRVLYGMEFPPARAAAQLNEDARSLVPAGKGHDWNSAIMDLGSAICTARSPKCAICPIYEVCAAAPIDAAALEAARTRYGRTPSPQERIPFGQSTRFTRGRIVDRLRELAPGERVSLLDLHSSIAPAIAQDRPRFDAIVRALAADGLLLLEDEKVALAE